MPGKCKYRESWSENYKWVLRVPNDDYKARCKQCAKSFDIANMGEAALKSHMNCKRHMKLASSGNDSIAQYVVTNPPDDAVTATNPPAMSTSRGDNLSSQQSSETSSTRRPLPTSSVSSFVIRNEVVQAEILWVLNTIDSNNSYNSCTGQSKLFQRMFPDSRIAESYTLSERKCSYLAQYGLAPLFRTSLIDQMKRNGDFVLLFDESLNKVTKSKQLDVHMRFWDSGKVTTHYLTSEFMGHATAVDLLSSFNHGIESLKGSLSHLVQISMDGPNVNWRFLGDFQKQLEHDYHTKIIDIGSCGLHIIHGAFKDGASASEWNVSKVLGSLYWLFKDTPARRDDFTTITGCTTFPMRFCQHRWLENLPVVIRAIQIWPSIQQYVKAVQQKTAKNPGTISYEAIEKACKDPLMTAKFSFFKRVAQIINPFLTNYQTDKPMLPFFASDMANMIIELQSIFIKRSEIDKIKKSTKKVLDFCVDNKDHHVSHNKIDIGIETDKILKGVHVSQLQTMELKMQSKAFVIKVIKKLQLKAPLKYALVRHAQCCNPVKMVNEPDDCISKMKQLLLILSEHSKIALDECDLALSQYRNIISDLIPMDRAKFSEYRVELSGVDTFFYELLSKRKEYTKVWDVVKLLLVMSHGQASVERGFSTNKAIEKDNMTEETFITQRIIKDFISASGGVANIQVTSKMLVSAASARSRYEAHLEEKRRTKTSVEQQMKRKSLVDELDELKKKRTRLQTDSESLTQRANELADKAETTRNFTFITQSNSLRKTAKSKSDDLKAVNEQIGAKVEALKN